MSNEKKDQTAAQKAKLVKMIRAEDVAKGGPTTADVHADEVDNYIAGGWSVAKAEGKK